MQARRFWNFETTENGENVLTIYKSIGGGESWFEDEITPGEFRAELARCKGDVTVYINSPGGDVFAASQIYTMLMEHPGNVTVKIDGLAASAASVIAMAGTEVLMSPTAMLMIHNPSTIAGGDHNDLQAAIDLLDEVKESIINAYELKTGMSRAKIARLMEEETWFNARKAVELGFADGILETAAPSFTADDAFAYSSRTTETAILERMAAKFSGQSKPDANRPTGRSVRELTEQLYSIKNY